ncbi:MAG TPA: outer membrane lipoprotein-sorting protein [Myxococcaceae bacterium]|nr:outer membrane lipoprotein-sorting protein [Myxococcaceae bacterium]
MISGRNLALAAMLCCAPALATSSESAEEIARKSRDRGALNLRDLSAEVRLTTVRGEKTKVQVLRTTAKEIRGRSHSLARFLSPPGVDGVTVLTIEGQGEEPDDISIYLPKLRRVRKVATSQRGQSFMDTDFNYADLAGTGAERKGVKRLADAKVGDRDAFVLQSDVVGDSPYRRVTLYVDKESYVPLRVDYADQDGRPFKHYEALKLRTFNGRILAAESVMKNLQSGSETRMEILRIEEATLGDEAFSERALERG